MQVFHLKQEFKEIIIKIWKKYQFNIVTDSYNFLYSIFTMIHLLFCVIESNGILIKNKRLRISFLIIIISSCLFPGDCYCYNCAAAGPELWASCCRESLRCCSHLAAACRTCDHPTLYPFCSKHFKKCLVELKKQN